MIVKLLTEHHLEFLSLKGGSRGSSESTQNVKLLEISCHGSNDVFDFTDNAVKAIFFRSKPTFYVLCY